MTYSVGIPTNEVNVTPYFKHVTIEDVPASEREGHQVMKTMEVVEVRFAGHKMYAPVFPANGFWKREGHKMITYAERWADQYRDFLNGVDQKAAGTPLEMLKKYGISDAQLSLCRALKIHSIESLHHLDGSNLKSLGMSANHLKKMADDFMADRAKGGESSSRIEALEREIERLRAVIPLVQPTPEQVEDAILVADTEFAAWEDERLKVFIAEKSGRRPLGNPNHDTLVTMATELAAA